MLSLILIITMEVSKRSKIIIYDNFRSFIFYLTSVYSPKILFYQSERISFEKSFRMKTNMKLPNMVISCSASTFF